MNASGMFHLRKCLPRLNFFCVPCWPEGSEENRGHDAFTKHNIPARRRDIREETYDQSAACRLAFNKPSITKRICKCQPKYISNAGVQSIESI